MRQPQCRGEVLPLSIQTGGSGGKTEDSDTGTNVALISNENAEKIRL